VKKASGPQICSEYRIEMRFVDGHDTAFNTAIRSGSLSVPDHLMASLREAGSCHQATYPQPMTETRILDLLVFFSSTDESPMVERI